MRETQSFAQCETNSSSTASGPPSPAGEGKEKRVLTHIHGTKRLRVTTQIETEVSTRQPIRRQPSASRRISESGKQRQKPAHTNRRLSV